jgi:protocatechuate 3,4-dioxygenase beta subunit
MMRGMKAIVVVIAVLLPVGKDLGSGATITGQVVDARTFLPLRGAVVSAARVKDARPDAPPNIGFLTGVDGKFILRGVSPGIVNFFVSKAGYAAGPYASVRPAADGEQIDNVVLTVAPGASLGGRILDESGQPVAGESITVRPARPSTDGTRGQPAAGVGSSDDDGQYWIGGLSPGEYVVTVGRSGDQAEIVSFGSEPVVLSETTNRPTFTLTANVTLRAGEERTRADVVIRFPTTFSNPRTANTGTATIEGRVVDRHGSGVRHAGVLLRRSEKSISTILTRADAAGRFRFQNLPPGSYSINALQSGLSFPLTETRQTTTLQIAAGSQTENVMLITSRGGTISGTLTDEFGDPVLGSVLAMTLTRLEQSADFRSIIPRADAMRIPGLVASTDAAGRYRITNLPPGEYLVNVDRGDLITARTEIHFWDSAGQDRELLPGLLFYPGVSTVSHASKITIDDGVDASGIDLTLRPGLNASINVTVTSSRPVGEVQLHQILLDDRLPILETTTKLTGSSIMLDARQGRYRLLASAEVASTADNVTRLWSSADVDADPLVPATVSMLLEPGANLSGRIVFEGNEPNRQNAGASLLPIASMLGIRIPTLEGNSTLTVATGEFSIEGVMPGRYVIQAGGSRALWMLKAAIVRGRDVLDEPIDLGAGEEIEGVRLTVTDRITVLTGKVADAADDLSRQDWIIVFPVDKKYWYPGSRRTRVARPDAKGIYTIRALPPGPYIVAVSPNAPSQADELQKTLQTLAASGVRVTLAEGDKKVQDLRRKL